MLDLFSLIDAENEDGYKEIHDRLQPKENIDYKELKEKEIFLWETSLGDLYLTYSCGNVLTIEVTDDNDNRGQCSTYEFDEYGYVSCVMSAIRSYLKDLDETFINEP